MAQQRRNRKRTSRPRREPAREAPAPARASAGFPFVVMGVAGVCAGALAWLISIALVAGGSWTSVAGDLSPELAVAAVAVGSAIAGLHLGAFRTLVTNPTLKARLVALVPLLVVDGGVGVAANTDFGQLGGDDDTLAAAVRSDDVSAFADGIEQWRATLPARQQRELDLRDRPDLLRNAARQGSAGVVAFILDEASSVRGCDGAAALEAAVQGDHQDVVGALIAGGVDVNSACGACRSEPALYVAAWNGSLGTVDALADAGADLECRGLDQATPLMKAAAEGHADVLGELIARGARVDAATSQGDTALTRAADSGHVDAVNTLVAHGAEVNPMGARRTPLMAAAAAGHVEVVDTLLSAGARVDESVLGYRDQPVRAVDLAQRRSHDEVVERLMLAGANPPFEG